MADQKKKRKKKIIHKRYSVTERMDALALLRENKYHYKNTSGQTGISAPTLRSWQVRHGRQVKDQSEMIEAINWTSEQIQSHKKDFIGFIYDTKFLIVQRMQELIPTARSINVLSDALTALHDMEKKEQNPEPTNMLAGDNKDFILNFVANQVAIIAPDGRMVRANKDINQTNEDHGQN